MANVRSHFGILLAAVLAGCGAPGATGAETAETTDATDPPEIPGLPRLTLGLAHTTSRFRSIVDEALAAADEPLSPPPRGPSVREFHRWVEKRLGPWLRRRGERLARATDALDRLRTGDADERVLGAAIVGHLYADTVGQVLDAERPRHLDAATEERLTATLRETVAPLEARAFEAFRTCVAAASGAPAHIDAWRRYCEERLRDQGASAP